MKIKKYILTALSIMLIIVMGTTVSHGKKKFKGKWKTYGVFTKVDRIEIKDNVKGHLISHYTSKGISKGFESGGVIISQGMSDLVNFNGPNSGYQTTVDKKGNRTYTKWQGKVKATRGRKGPKVTFAGTWKFIGGTGKFRNIMGSGTYKGMFIGKGIWVNNIDGEYTY